MGDLGSDTLAELANILDAHAALRKKEPRHELLSLITVHDDGRGCDFTPEYYKRFSSKHDQYPIQGYGRYLCSLRDALLDWPIEPV